MKYNMIIQVEDTDLPSKMISPMVSDEVKLKNARMMGETYTKFLNQIGEKEHLKFEFIDAEILED